MFDDATSGGDCDERVRSEYGLSGWSDHRVRELYDQLRSLAERRLQREPPGQTLQPTALVHEVFLRLESGNSPAMWDNNAHFFGSAAEAMRRILIEKAREKLSLKRGGGRQRVAFAHVEGVAVLDRAAEVLAIDDAIGALESLFPDHAAIVKLRFFAGYKHQEIAAILDVSLATIERKWQFARAWLRAEIGDEVCAGADGA